MKREVLERGRGVSPPMNDDGGFTLVELMVVVLIIGILVAIAILVYPPVIERAQSRSCLANQRTVQGAVNMWKIDATTPVSSLAGIVDASNPLMSPKYLAKPPRCPAAPHAVDPDNPTLSEGAYSIDASGNVLPCDFGIPVHGGL